MGSAPYDHEQERKVVISTTPPPRKDNNFPDIAQQALYRYVEMPGGIQLLRNQGAEVLPGQSRNVRLIGAPLADVVQLTPLHERDTAELPVVPAHNDDLGNIA